MAFNTIQPLALRIRSDAQPLVRDCITIPFPRHWATEFRRLQALVANRPADKTTIPIASLNRTLRAVVPPIISIERRAATRWALDNNRPWFYTRTQIEPAVLVKIVHSWARVLFDVLPTEQVSQVLAQVQTHDVQWNIEPVDLVAWEANAAGTATPRNPGQFILFPDYVAATLSGINEGFQYGDHQLHFRRSSLPPGQKGAELTSWPPLQDGDALYSVVLTFTMQTVPFQPYPVLHCDVSLRRWAGPKRVFLKQRASTYIATSLPFIPDLDGWPNQLQVASLKREPVANEGWRTQWDDRLVGILAQLGSPVSLLDAEQLTNTPATGQRDWDNAAAIVYSTRMKRHRIGAGVTIRERSQLFDQITELLGDVFEPIKPLPRVGPPAEQKIDFRENPFLVDKQKRKQSYPMRRSLIREAIGDQLCIEICANSTEVRDKLVDAVQSELGIELNTDKQQEISTPELRIAVTFSSLGDLTDNLEVGGGRGARERVRDATLRRITEIVRVLPAARTPTLMLAEILAKDQYATNSDPKSALRIGIGRSRRLAQFITADRSQALPAIDESGDDETAAPLRHRAVNALLDGLRQLGVPGMLPLAVRTGQPCTILGTWLINKKSSKQGAESYRLPVLVRISSADMAILAIAPGFANWLPYREALLELAKTDVVNSQTGRANHTAFLRTQIRDALSSQNDTLLICHAQNMRETWGWVSNSGLVPDSVAFSPGETPSPISEWPGLRIVRVRDSQSHETPEWFAEQDGKRSASTGLFRMGERVFASTHQKPKQMKSYSHYFSKAERWSYPETPGPSKRPAPRRPTWNPGLYELTVAALQPEDQGDAAVWAYLTHRLRRSNLHFEDATALPLPLHLAKLMEEYILSVEIQGDEEEG